MTERMFAVEIVLVLIPQPMEKEQLSYIDQRKADLEFQIHSREAEGLCVALRIEFRIAQRQDGNNF